MDSQNSSPDDAAVWARLTDKQRDCLDLILARKTSKQIARILGIAKPTVDQRIAAAKTILGVADRDEAAIAYGRLKAIYDRITYDPAQLPPWPALVPSDFQDGDPDAVLSLHDTVSRSLGTGKGSMGGFLPSGDIWRHDHEIRQRITIMVAGLVALMIVLLAGLAIAQSLSQLYSG
ncbi:helix-turn-helix domain-containing protein [Sphingopyxis sp. H115]|uniref:helix-turn-helix domain-containing protein n=1 Tax=Sphingopyxis sp. H115 TaxID=1759073 RepID=UPI0007373F8A|nr:helix-turn-helix transcriptional regulator [Sphingopyxis sp. H115]KTE15574.1 helix-turn-helix transcriptional regulator [Sphingopyxis sp. H115]